MPLTPIIGHAIVVGKLDNDKVHSKSSTSTRLMQS